MLLPRPVAPEVLRADVPRVCRGLRPRAGAQERSRGPGPGMGRVDRGEAVGEAARFGVHSAIHPLLQWGPGTAL